mgnify:CR=1 FL=1
MKKIIKITGITLLIIMALLVAIPFAFQSQIKDAVKQLINENLNAQVEFSDLNLSLLRHFPKASVSVSDLVITNYEPFKDETFVSAKSIAFDMPITELFNIGKAPIAVNAIVLDDALVTLKTNKNGITNYDITKKETTEVKESSNDLESESSSFSLDIEKYAINNSALTYIDEPSKMTIHITEFNHSGKGIFSTEVSELDTQTNANISLSMDSTSYLKNNAIKLDAIIGLDLVNSKFSFKENTAYLNQLQLIFDGFVKLNESDQEIDITFKNPGSSFKDFLALIPESYSKNLEGVETTGNFDFKGNVKGILSEHTIPTFNINLASNNAAFKYPDLPKGINDIDINIDIKNTTGNVDNTEVDLKTLNFKIDEDKFKSSAKLRNLTKNMLVNASIDGVLNLSKLSQAYPITLDNELSGVLKANLKTDFDMNAVETNAFDRIKMDGLVAVNDFVFSSKDIINPLNISNAEIEFNPEKVALNSFNATSGQSDLNASGAITNLLGFLLSKQELKGDFKVVSNTFSVSDFMIANDDVVEETTNENSTTETETASGPLKIPAFLNCNISADVKQVIYDNLNLKDVTGMLAIKDQAVTLKNMSTSVFNGRLGFEGEVNTQKEIPAFNMNLDISNFDISQTFKGMEMMQSLAPIAKALQGTFNTKLNLSGTLGDDFSPNLKSLTGDAFAELLTSKIEPKNAAVFEKLTGALSFINFNKLNLSKLKAHLSFNNGQVVLKPVNFNYDDIGISLGGAHGLDNTMSYDVVFRVPAKYLGSDVNKLIAKIDKDAANELTVPITANITGSFTQPQVKTDLKSGVTGLTKQLVELEKQKLVNSGKEKLKDLIGNAFNKKKEPSESSSEDSSSKTTAKTSADSTQTTKVSNEDKKKEAVKGLLNGLLKNRKKKNDTTKKP